MSWKFTNESFIKYLRIRKWTRWIRPKYIECCTPELYVYLLGPELSAIVEIALRGFGGTAGEILWGNAGKFWIVGLGGTGGGMGFPEGLKDIIEIDMSCLEKMILFFQEKSTLSHHSYIIIYYYITRPFRILSKGPGPEMSSRKVLQKIL